MSNEMNIQNSQTPAVKKVFVDLWARELVRQRLRIVVEVPFDCEEEKIEGLGSMLEYLACVVSCDRWEIEDGEVYDVYEVNVVETGVPENVEADIVLWWDEDGELVGE